MFKKTLLFPLILICAAFVSAQKLPKPKQMPGTLTPQQDQIVREGIGLHDAKKYDDAIAKYLAVLKDSPDSTLTMYELALSYYNKGDCAKAKETSFRGSAYISDELPLFYGTVANCFDDEGKPDEAIKIYKEAEDILQGVPNMQGHLASVYYNLGLTYFRQKKYLESRAELKKSVDANFGYVSTHYLLSVIYGGTKYKVPALLAAARFISLEYNTDRTKRSVGLIASTLKPASTDPKTGNMTINLDFSAPKDEGDFAMYDLMLGTLTSVRGKDDEKKTDNQMFVDAVGSIFAMLEEDKKLSSTFVGKTYIPFVSDLKKKGHVEALANMVLYIENNNNAEAAKWVRDNGPKLNALITWAKAYQAPRK